MIIKTIGTGTFARVCLAKQKGSHKLVTIIIVVIIMVIFMVIIIIIIMQLQTNIMGEH